MKKFEITWTLRILLDSLQNVKIAQDGTGVPDHFYATVKKRHSLSIST